MIEELQGTINPDVLLKSVNQMFGNLDKKVSPFEEQLILFTTKAVESVRMILNGNAVTDEMIWGLVEKQHFYSGEVIDTPEYALHKKHNSKWYVILFHRGRSYNGPTQIPKPEIKIKRMNDFKQQGRELLDHYMEHGFPLERVQQSWSWYDSNIDQVHRLVEDKLNEDLTPEMRRVIVMGRKHLDTLKQLAKDVEVVDLGSIDIGRTILSELSTIERFIGEFNESN